MKKGMAPVIVVVIVLVGALFGLGVWSSKSTTSGSDDNNQQSKQQQSSQQNAGAPPPADPADKPVTNLQGDLVSSLLPMQTIGNPSAAKTKITVGYTFDSFTQEHPEKAAAIIDAIRDWATKQGSAASLQLVCVDLPADQFSGPNAAYADIPVGISINGKQPPGFNANPGEGTYTSATVLSTLGGS